MTHRSRGVTSTTPRPVAPRCTPRRSPSLLGRGRPRGHDAHVVRGRSPAGDAGVTATASIRKAGRYLVFPRAAFSEMMGWHGARDGLVEIWNGMPFFSPVWARTPHVAWLHHVHAEMWEMTLPPRLARARAASSSRELAPPLYRRTPIVTLSESSQARARRGAGLLAPTACTVVPPGHRPAVHAGRREVARRRSSSRSAGSCP